MDGKNFELIYSDNEDKTFGTGFVINRKYEQKIMNFEAVDDRICYLRIRGNFNIVTIISAPAATEEKDELVRTAFTIN